MYDRYQHACNKGLSYGNADVHLSPPRGAHRGINANGALTSSLQAILDAAQINAAGKLCSHTFRKVHILEVRFKCTRNKWDW